MEKIGHSKGYIFCLVLFCVFVAVKLAALVIVAISFARLLSGEAATDSVTRLTIYALLGDFFALIAVWLLDKKVCLLRKRERLALLLAPLLWIAVFVISLAADPAAESTVTDTVGFILIGVYLLGPDALIAAAMLRLRRGLPDEYAPRELTLSERVRKAKK